MTQRQNVRESSIEKSFAEIEILFLDFDGVLTDNHVWIDEGGGEVVRCSRADGIGLSRIRDFGVEAVVLSTEKNPVVSKRCEKLGLECHQALNDKVVVACSILKARKITLGSCAFMGNDINDLPLLSMVGLAVCPSDAVQEVISKADFVCERKGGDGVVREFCDLIYRARKESNVCF